MYVLAVRLEALLKGHVRVPLRALPAVLHAVVQGADPGARDPRGPLFRDMQLCTPAARVLGHYVRMGHKRPVPRPAALTLECCGMLDWAGEGRAQEEGSLCCGPGHENTGAVAEPAYHQICDCWLMRTVP